MPRLIQRRQLAEEYSYRPPIRDDVMHRQQQHHLLVRDAQQLRPQQWSATQIKRPPCFFPTQSRYVSLPLALRHTAQVVHRQFKLQAWHDHLRRLAVYTHEPRAQHFMPSDYFIQTPTQCFHIHLRRQHDGCRDVVNRPIGFELIKQPESFLRERNREDKDIFLGTVWRITCRG